MIVSLGSNNPQDVAFLLYILFFFICMCVCLPVYMCTTCVQSLQRPEEVTRHPVIEILVAFELPYVDTPNRTEFFCMRCKNSHTTETSLQDIDLLTFFFF